jgi:heme-degrading monooxygenase HmoA
VPEPRYVVDARPGASEPIPAVVSLHLFGVPTSAVPRALGRMGLDRRAVRRIPGVTFAKLLGTGSGRTFTPRDADPHHWSVLICWSDEDGPARFEESSAYRGWHSIAHEESRFLMRPLVSRGEWAGRTPFGDPRPHRWDGPIAAVTRARIKTAQWRRFWSAVPPVSGDLRAVDGLRLAMGIGEAPVGLQGTFSVWESNAALTEFAHRRSPHAEVMRRTHDVQWYAEELFARFALVDSRGIHDGRPVAP